MNRFFSEFIGTLVLVLMGCGAAVVNHMTGALGHSGVALGFGLVVMVMIYSVGNISGAHLNPAVSLGFLLAGRIPLKDLLLYLPAQFGGALCAAALLRVAFPGQADLGATLPAGAPLAAFLIEVVLSALLMFVILNVSTGHKEKGIMAGVAVGGAVALCALVGGPLTGASMNPARSLGPALFSPGKEYLWIYLTAPFLGTALASPSCRIIQQGECCAVQEETL
ncbi:MAG: aquaporin [Spirochaetales bacterium]|nr:aquaporin [Spirochaetales bacterium]